MFLSRNKKNNVYPCKPQFYYIKVGFKGVKIAMVCFRDDPPKCKFSYVPKLPISPVLLHIMSFGYKIPLFLFYYYFFFFVYIFFITLTVFDVNGCKTISFGSHPIFTEETRVTHINVSNSSKPSIEIGLAETETSPLEKRRLADGLNILVYV